MKLNINSRSARLYRWFYGSKDMPQNLCLYFWKLVTMYVFLLPFTIVTLPYMIIFSKGEPEPEPDIFLRIIFSLSMWFIMFICIVMMSPILLLFGETINGSYKNLFIGAFIMYLFVGVLFLNAGISKLKNRSCIITEYVKAKFYKFCPKIDWR